MMPACRSRCASKRRRHCCRVLRVDTDQRTRAFAPGSRWFLRDSRSMPFSFPDRIAIQALAALLFALLAGSACAQADVAVPHVKDVDSIEARVQGCVTCHGQNGQGTNNGYFPRIAGKPAGYLYNQLAAFRDGTRRYASMYNL